MKQGHRLSPLLFTADLEEIADSRTGSDMEIRVGGRKLQ